MSTLFHCVNIGTMSVVRHRKNVLWLCCVYKQWHCHWKTVPRNRLLDGKCWKIEAAFQEIYFTWITGKIFLTPTTSTSADMEVECGTHTVYFYCQGPDEGEMVACDNPHCIYQWFYMECLHLDTPPTSRTWYCPDCRKLRMRNGKGTK